MLSKDEESVLIEMQSAIQQREYPRRSKDPDERFWIGLGRKIRNGDRIPDGYDRHRRR